MKNLDDILKQAARATRKWERQDVDVLLGALARAVQGGSVDWHPGDEEWGRVLLPTGSPAAMVCARFPLAIVGTSEIDQTLVPNDVLCVHVSDMSVPVFSVTTNVLQDAFARPLSDNLNYNALSADDLWWATV